MVCYNACMGTQANSKIGAVAKSRKTAGSILLASGVIVLFVVVPIFYVCMYKSTCNSDPNGWCGFGVFCSSLCIILFGFVLAIMGAIESTTAKKIQQGKIALDPVVLKRKPSIVSRYFRGFILALLISIMILSVPAFFGYISGPDSKIMSLVSIATFFASVILIAVIKYKWK